MRIKSFGFCNTNTNQLNLQSESNPYQNMTLELATGTSHSNDCASFTVAKMIAYYSSEGDMVEVTMTDAEENECFGLLNGSDGCSDLRRYETHQFEFNETYPWVGFHGQLQYDTITALGLIIYDTLSVKCKPYSDQFLSSTM